MFRSLSGFDGQAISVMGLQDQIINWDNYEEAKANLPPDTTLMEIEGLNHSDFGNYGLQKGDGRSSLSNAQVVEIICGTFN